MSKPAIIEINHFAHGLRRAVGEVGRTRRETAQLLHHDRADIRAAPGNEGAARVRCVDHTPQIRMRVSIARAGDLEHRQIARLRPGGRLGPGGEGVGSDINPSGGKILAGHLRVMAGRASPLQRIAQTDGIDVRGIPDPELPVHEDVRPARDRCAVVSRSPFSRS